MRTATNTQAVTAPAASAAPVSATPAATVVTAQRGPGVGMACVPLIGAGCAPANSVGGGIATQAAAHIASVGALPSAPTLVTLAGKNSGYVHGNRASYSLGALAGGAYCNKPPKQTPALAHYNQGTGMLCSANGLPLPVPANVAGACAPAYGVGYAAACAVLAGLGLPVNNV
jgi:hypothetical protein